jgi:hypothetical protein
MRFSYSEDLTGHSTPIPDPIISPAGRAPGPSRPTVGKDDPRYFDLNWFPTPDPGQHWTEARKEQIAAISAAEALRDRDSSKARCVRRRRPRRTAEATWPTEAVIADETPLRDRFAALLPPSPYYTDDPSHGVRIGPRAIALRHRHVQLNGPNVLTWFVFDIDRRDAVFAATDGNLPPPNFIAVNTEEGDRWGHAHVGYLLAKPVHKFAASRRKPMEWAAAVQRGLRRRLDADPAYFGPLAKNPLHPDWHVIWLRDEPYLLEELAGALFPNDMRPDPRRRASGLSRDCDCFDDTRQWAYRNVLAFKRAGGTSAGWIARCREVASGYNVFSPPLTRSEIRKIGKSVARWTWLRFTEEGFSRRQALRGKRGLAKRWAGHVALEKLRPWETEGVSRATWYRRHGAAGTSHWSAKQGAAARYVPRETIALSGYSAHAGPGEEVPGVSLDHQPPAGEASEQGRRVRM